MMLLVTAFAANSQSSSGTNLPDTVCLPVAQVQKSIRVKDSLEVFKKIVQTQQEKIDDQKKALDLGDIALLKSDRLDSTNKALIVLKEKQFANSELAGKLLELKNAELEKQVKKERRKKKLAFGGMIVATGFAIYSSVK